MAATDRVILMVEPTEKAGWASRARSVGVSTSEFIRRAVAAYDPELTPADQEEIAALSREVRESAARMDAMLDRAVASLRELNDPTRDERIRARVATDLPHLDLSRLGDLAA